MQVWKDATFFKLLEFLFNGLQDWFAITRIPQQLLNQFFLLTTESVNFFQDRYTMFFVFEFTSFEMFRNNNLYSDIQYYQEALMQEEEVSCQLLFSKFHYKLTAQNNEMWVSTTSFFAYLKMFKIKKVHDIFIHEITKIKFNQFSKFLIMTVDQNFLKN